MSARAQSVLQRTVLERDPAEDVDVEQDLDRAEDGRAADAPRRTQHVFDREMRRLCEHRLEHASTAQSHAMAPQLQTFRDQIDVRHLRSLLIPSLIVVETKSQVKRSPASHAAGLLR